MSCAFVFFQNHTMVRDGQNNLHPGEYSRRRADYSHIPYMSGNHGRRHGIWPEIILVILVILFNHVANFLSVGSGWRFDSVQSLAISLCPLRPTIGAGSFIDTPKYLYKKGSIISKILKMNTVSSDAFSRIYTELVIMWLELQNMNLSCMNSILQD